MRLAYKINYFFTICHSGMIFRRDRNEAVTPNLHRLPNLTRSTRMNGFTKVRDQIYVIFENSRFVSVYG